MPQVPALPFRNPCSLQFQTTALNPSSMAMDANAYKRFCVTIEL